MLTFRKPSVRTVVSGTVLGIILVLSLANSNNPPNGRTGAPGEGTCSGCHLQTGPPQDGSIDVSGFPATIVPNQTYPLTVTVSNPNGLAEIAGFQMTILNSANANAGSLSNPSAGSTITTFAGRVYHEHNPAQPFNVANEVEWTVDWTAPNAMGVDQITLYSIAIVANDNGSNTGDLQVQQQLSGTIEGTTLDVLAASTDVTCFDASDGTAIAEASGGTPPYSYLWSNGGSQAEIAGLGPGVYSVTATDAMGSTGTAETEVLEPPSIEISISMQSDVNCNGGADGSATIQPAGGIPPYSILWSNGQNGATLLNVPAGTYTATVSDANACIANLDVTISEPDALSVTTIVLGATCGQANGSIEAFAMGGVGGYTYIWSNGEVTSLIENLASGVYNLTVSDANGCSVEMTEFVDDQPGPEIVEISSTPALCGMPTGTASVSASAGTAPLAYLWSNGETSASISGLAAGVYSVTVTDANMCTATASIEVAGQDAPAVVLISEPILCFGGTTNIVSSVTGGQPPFTYLWSDGQQLDSLGDVGAGMYSLTVTDSNGCSGSASITVGQPAQLVLTFDVQDESGPGLNDGSVLVMATGGTTPYVYSWNNGATTAQISGLSPGMYCVTVTDANGCSAQGCATVNAFGCTLDAEIAGTAVSCFGASDATATLTFSGASGPVGVVWSTGDTTLMIDSLLAGTYTVTVTDSAGCVASANVTITEPSELASSCEVGPGTEPGLSDATCIISGGTPPYTGPGMPVNDSTFLHTGLAPGTYSFTYTDANGCDVKAEFNVLVECNGSFNLSVIDAACFGDSSGIAWVETTGINSPLIEWSSGAVGDTVSNLPFGDYTVIVIDTVLDCTYMEEFQVDQPALLTISIDTVIHESGSGNDGAISITVSGGTAPYAYAWFRSGFAVGTGEDLENIIAGEYTVFVTDANNCSQSAGPITVEMTSYAGGPDPSGSIIIMPNPTHSMFWIQIAPGLNVSRIEMLNTNGRLIRRIDTGFPGSTSIPVNTDDLQAGVYYVLLYGQETTITRKVVRY